MSSPTPAKQKKLTYTANPVYQVAEVELRYKNQPDIASRPQVTASKDAYKVLLQSWDENKIGFVEQAKLLLLNRSNRVLGIYELSTGGIAGTIVDPRLVFIAALKANASAIILAHNHPSCNLKPSSHDVAITKQLAEAGKLLDIPVTDHLIVTSQGYYSFADECGL